MGGGADMLKVLKIHLPPALLPFPEPYKTRLVRIPFCTSLMFIYFTTPFLRMMLAYRALSPVATIA